MTSPKVSLCSHTWSNASFKRLLTHALTRWPLPKVTCFKGYLPLKLSDQSFIVKFICSEKRFKLLYHLLNPELTRSQLAQFCKFLPTPELDRRLSVWIHITQECDSSGPFTFSGHQTTDVKGSFFSLALSQAFSTRFSPRLHCSLVVIFVATQMFYDYKYLYQSLLR